MKTSAKQQKLVIAYSPLESLADAPTKHEVNPKDSLTTLCGMSCEGWRFIHGRSEKPLDQNEVTCNLCRRSRRSRERGDSNSQKQ